jgi:hypothetical protein
LNIGVLSTEFVSEMNKSSRARNRAITPAGEEVPGGHLPPGGVQEEIPGPTGPLIRLLLTHPRHRDVFVKDFGFVKA